MPFARKTTQKVRFKRFNHPNLLLLAHHLQCSADPIQKLFVVKIPLAPLLQPDIFSVLFFDIFEIIFE